MHILCMSSVHKILLCITNQIQETKVMFITSCYINAAQDLSVISQQKLYKSTHTHHTYACTHYIYIHVLIHTHTHMHARMHARTHARTHTHTHTHTALLFFINIINYCVNPQSCNVCVQYTSKKIITYYVSSRCIYSVQVASDYS